MSNWRLESKNANFGDNLYEIDATKIYVTQPNMGIVVFVALRPRPRWLSLVLLAKFSPGLAASIWPEDGIYQEENYSLRVFIYLWTYDFGLTLVLSLSHPRRSPELR